MILYKLGLELLSPVITPLKGDTIWGHIVWGIAHNEGADAVAAFLAEEKQTPHLIVSSAFPTGFLCLPLPEPQKRTEALNTKTYSKIKEKKKQRYVSAGRFLSGCLEGNTAVSEQQGVFTALPVMHNAIDRYSDTVMEGNLFSVTEYWSSVKTFDIYILSDFTADRVLQLCTWAFENGYGADASAGKGYIRITGAPKTVEPIYNGNKYLALAPFVLGADDTITDLRADIFVRTGKIGGSFAGYMNPYKKPVILYDEGAVFISEKPIVYAGCLLTDVHSDKRICQAGFAPVIPIE